MRILTTHTLARALAGVSPALLATLALSLTPACDDDATSPAGPNDPGGGDASAGSQDPGGSTDPNGSSDPSLPSAPTGLPCGVQEALVEACQTCHGTELSGAAPMPLTNYDELMAPGISDDSRPMWELVGERINRTDATRMPPQAFDISAEHLDALNAWVDAGAPRAEEGEECAVQGPIGGGQQPLELPCDEPDHLFLASGNGPDGGYQVPSGGDGNFYTCFPFASPFEAGEQITAMVPVIDQASVLHHYILWETAVQPATMDPFECAALPTSDSKFVAGWAPGGQANILPEDVGIKTRPGSYYLLQVHYWNVAGHQIYDKSGVSMCSTTDPRPHNAGVIGVGPININIPPRSEGTTISAGCPGIQTAAAGGFTILGTSPHAHQFATSFKTELIRASGEVITLSDVDPWDFENQTGYIKDPPVRVEPFDTIRATCTWDNPTDQTITWGENTEDEMCFDFMTIYPIEPWENSLPDFCVWPM
jgi:hypothetical protein